MTHGNTGTFELAIKCPQTKSVAVLPISTGNENNYVFVIFPSLDVVSMFVFYSHDHTTDTITQYLDHD